MKGFANGYFLKFGNCIYEIEEGKFIVSPGLRNKLFDGECVSNQTPGCHVPTLQALGGLGEGAA